MVAAIAVAFGDSAQSLRNVVAAHADRLAGRETLWLRHPKGHRNGSNAIPSPILTEHGLRSIGQVSLGRGWSAVRFRLWGERNLGPWADAKSAGPH
jgi:hypothetical protein